MAGGIVSKDPKNKKNTTRLFSGQNSPEFVTDNSQTAKTDGFRGVLGLGQSEEISKSSNIGKEFYQPSHLEHEATLLVQQDNQELKKAISELVEQIKSLTHAAKTTQKEIEKIGLEENPEPSIYKVNFLQRLATYLKNITKNINEAGEWANMFTIRCKQRGKFWNNVKNKKGGGEQYLFSSEHSTAPSVG